MKVKNIKNLESQAQELVAEAEETGKYDGEKLQLLVEELAEEIPIIID